MYYAPFEDWRRIDVGADHAGPTWAEGVRRLVEEDFPQAQRITLVMDNLSTHTGASLYKTFRAGEGARLAGQAGVRIYAEPWSWLNIAKCEFRRAVAPMFGSPDSRHRLLAHRSGRLDRSAQSSERLSAVALHDR